jgi:CheY-like chemotaxis protein
MQREVFTVLVADDQREIVTTISNWLRQAGHVAVSAASGREALALIRSMHLDGLVTDLVMPNGNGIELIMDVRAAKPDLRIVAISSVDQTEAALAAGANRCLRKPLNPRDVLAAVFD